MFVDDVVCGDSERLLKLVPDGSVDLVFTSPPYNAGMKYDVYNDSVVWGDYFSFLGRVFDECVRVLKDGGRIVVNVAPSCSGHVPTHHVLSNMLLNRGLLWYTEIIWEKRINSASATAFGSWKSPSKPYFTTTWEYLLVYSKGSLKHEGKSVNADVTVEEFKEWVRAMWDVRPESSGDFAHPAMFPEELAYRVIKMFSFRGDLVLDPFCGAGTTVKVARLLGRHFIGIDISPEYCRIAKERLSKVSEQSIL
jgi:DNA modification methylase